MENTLLMNLRKFLVPEIVYGEGAMQLAGRHAGNLGASKVLIVTDPGIQEAGWVSKVEMSLRESGIPFTVFIMASPFLEEERNFSKGLSRQASNIIIFNLLLPGYSAGFLNMLR